MGLRAGLDRCGKSRHHRDSNPDRPARRQSLYRLRYPAIRCAVDSSVPRVNAHSRGRTEIDFLR
jgi:hypothetical protein